MGELRRSFIFIVTVVGLGELRRSSMLHFVAQHISLLKE